jgi:hypothetical protein
MSKTKREHAAEYLARAVKEGMEEKPLLSQMELENEEDARKLKQGRMDKRLASLPPEGTRPKPCPRCGKNARVRAKEVERTFTSLSGTHTIRRNYHFCEACKEGFFPRDRFLGLPEEGEVSVELEKRLADFVLNDVLEECEARWRVHYPHQPVSSNQFRQVAKRLGFKVEEANPELLQSALLPPSTQRSKTLYVMNDSGMVPLRGEWRAVKVGAFFREENHVSSREEKRGILSTARYVAQLGGQENFRTQMEAAHRIENVVPAECIAYLADGAPENWALASAICPSAIQILDWYHAVEAVMRCGKVLLGEKDAAGLLLWDKACKHLLSQGDVDGLVGQLMDCLPLTLTDEQLKAIDDLVRYVRNNQTRMKYADYLKRGLLIGSGPVESAHRHVIQTRMKRAGQRWSEKGARQMARMRAAYRTAGPERFYDAIHWAYRETRKAAPQLASLAAARRPPRKQASNR